MRPGSDPTRVLVHLATGIGYIMLATPLLLALRERYFRIDLLLHADYPGVDALFRGWSALNAVFDGRARERPAWPYDILVPAIPPFAWSRFAAEYRAQANAVQRPPDDLFYQNEQQYYLAFAERLGCRPNPMLGMFLPVAPAPTPDVNPDSLILAPGCKTGVMARKRWPYYPELASLFPDVVVVGTQDDLRTFDETPICFPPHVRSLVDRLSLPELAGVLAAARVVVTNDSGIGHMAAAVGVSTVLIFGPTPDRALGTFPANATVMRSNLPCETCWFTNRFTACDGRMTCLQQVSVAAVAAAVRSALYNPGRDE
jgi:ADP-heptose:LPS heptosyltransferase